MTKQRLALIAFTLLLPLAVGSSLWLKERHESKELRGPSTDAPGAIKREVGEQTVYELDYAAEVVAGTQPILEVRVQAVWQTTILAVTNLGSRVHSVLLEPKLESTTGEEAQRQQVRAELGRAHLFSMDKTGAIQTVELPPVSAITDGLLRSIVSAQQFVLPADGSSRMWQPTESDNVGRYRATYLAGTNGSWRKQKLNYVEVASSSLGLAGFQTDIVKSEWVFNLDDQRRVTNLDAHEETKVPASGPMPELRSKMAVTLRLVGRERLLDVAPLVAATLGFERRSVTAAGKDSLKLETDRARTEATSFDKLMSELESNGTTQTTARARQYSSLAAFMRLDRAAVAEAAGRIRRNDPQKNTLIDALGDAGTPEAQATLTEVMKDGPSADAGRALASLSFVEQPTPETVTAVADLVDHPVHGLQARYGLGAFVYNLRERAPERAKEVLEDLLARLGGSDNSAEISSYLRALGNAGDAAALPRIVEFVDHESETVRVSVARALRRISGLDADRYMALLMTKDASAMVRAAALEVARQRSASALLTHATETLVMGEPDKSVRGGAVRLAGQWLKASPSLRRALEWAVEHDREPSVRQLAREALDRAG